MGGLGPEGQERRLYGLLNRLGGDRRMAER